MKNNFDLNEIHSSDNKNDDNQFHVQVIETDASIRSGLKPIIIYKLVIQSNQIQLEYDGSDDDDNGDGDHRIHNHILYTWPYKYVRRYGYTSNSVSFEAGSKCKTGEGLFIFRNKKSKILFNQITINIDRIKRRQHFSHSMDDMKNQLMIIDRLESINENTTTTTANQTVGIDEEKEAKKVDVEAKNSFAINEQSNFDPNEHHRQQKHVPHFLINGCPYAQVIRK